jgi:hypothetical protein
MNRLGFACCPQVRNIGTPMRLAVGKPTPQFFIDILQAIRCKALDGGRARPLAGYLHDELPSRTTYSKGFIVSIGMDRRFSVDNCCLIGDSSRTDWFELGVSAECLDDVFRGMNNSR